jgi:hypothetical protein
MPNLEYDEVRGENLYAQCGELCRSYKFFRFAQEIVSHYVRNDMVFSRLYNLSWVGTKQSLNCTGQLERF